MIIVNTDGMISETMDLSVDYEDIPLEELRPVVKRRSLFQNVEEDKQETDDEYPSEYHDAVKMESSKWQIEVERLRKIHDHQNEDGTMKGICSDELDDVQKQFLNGAIDIHYCLGLIGKFVQGIQVYNISRELEKKKELQRYLNTCYKMNKIKENLVNK